MFTKKTIIIMSIIIGVLLVFIAGLLIWKNFSIIGPAAPKNAAQTPIGSSSEASIKAGKDETKSLIDNPGSLAKTVKVGSTTAVIVAPGTNPISVDTGEVLAKTGEVAKNNSQQGMLDSVTQSLSVDPAALTGNTIKLKIDSNSITPKEFTVHPGQTVSWAVTNAASWSEIIIFNDASLRAVGFSLTPNETRAITFKAPDKAGEYLFYSDVPQERARGVEGKMIVK